MSAAGPRPYQALSQGDETIIQPPIDLDFSKRPATYFNEGHYSPPSSDDGLEEKDGLAGHHYLDDEDDEYHGPSSPNQFLEAGLSQRKRKQPTALRALLLCLAGLIGAAALIGLFAASSYNGTSFRIQGRKTITLDHVFNGTFNIERQSLHWVPEAGDGVFSEQKDGNIILVDLKTSTNKTLVSRQEVLDEHGHPLAWSAWTLSHNMEYILFKTDKVQQWRHSSFGNYYVHTLKDHTTAPLAAPSNPPKISYAVWSPVGSSIAYVSENDIYVVRDAKSPNSVIRATTGGNSSFFHGVPDWVYEEEVFENDFALWWSPDSERIAYLTLDETSVEVYDFPIYNPTDNSSDVHPYPEWVSMRYPKPGYNNPLVSIQILSLDDYDTEVVLTSPHNSTIAVAEATTTLTWPSKLSGDDSIIFSVTWIGNETLIVKEVSRAGDKGSVVYFDVRSSSFRSSGSGKVVRTLGENGEEGDKGWIESGQRIYPISSDLSSLVGESAYLDIVPNKEGFNHIALYSPADTSVPRWLTGGEWEVVDKILGVDAERGLVYFLAASESGIDRHLYSVEIPDVSGAPPTAPHEPKNPLVAITDVSESATYTASFSPKAGFYLLGYNGPLIPWQRVVSVADTSLTYTLTDNQRLNETNADFQSPITTISTIESDGYMLNVKEMRPPGLDESGRVRYPVLFQVYGGPGSQLVDSRFKRDWHDYLVCTLKFIVVIVDGRGTGFKGRDLRNPVRGTLGYYETLDQINAARIWATKRYVDPRRIGIWGWSYGGYMTSKVMEADAGIHTLGIAVAPVVSWRMYDSIYTERYMKTPSVNEEGYRNASITDVEGFKNADFLLMHGSGDDNVHYANTAHLLDMFTQHQVRNFRFRMFTDSAHSIQTRGANRELYEYSTAFLVEKWGKGPVRRF